MTALLIAGAAAFFIGVTVGVGLIFRHAWRDLTDR